MYTFLVNNNIDTVRDDDSEVDALNNNERQNCEHKTPKSYVAFVHFV